MRSTPDLLAAQWRKSSYSGGQEGDACVEIGEGIVGLVPVRDSKDPQGPALTFTAAVWHSFIDSLTQGELPTA